MLRPPRRTDLPPERMTPVRVRGKRGQKALLQAQKKRVMQQAPSEESETIPEPAHPTLERLPNEILERIFLFSRNVALPQASLTLGKALSSTYVKHRLLRALFTDECMGNNLHLVNELSVGRLQSKLLRCRWVDLPSIQRALAASMTSMLCLLLGKPTEIFSGRDPLTLGIPNALAETGCPLQDYSTAELSNFVDDVFSNPTNGEAQRCLTWPFHDKIGNRSVVIDAERAAIRMSHNPVAYVLGPRRGCEIPTRLLHGPWTTSKMDFLEFLKYIRVTIDPEHSNNHEVAMESLKDAIVQGDLSVASLLTRWYGDGRDNYFLPVSEEHVRLAIFEGGCNKEMINLLELRGYPENINWNRDDFVEWAIEHKARGDERGSWLLETLEAHAKTRDRRIREARVIKNLSDSKSKLR